MSAIAGVGAADVGAERARISAPWKIGFIAILCGMWMRNRRKNDRLTCTRILRKITTIMSLSSKCLMINSREILQRLSLKSGKTLTRWSQRGLIPSPTIKTHPNGRGKLGYWEPWVLGRCFEIKALLKKYSLDELPKFLSPPPNPKSPPLAPTKGIRTPRLRRKASTDFAFVNWEFVLASIEFGNLISDKVCEALHRAGIQRPGIGRKLKEMAGSDFTNNVLAIICAGCNPVAVIINDKLHAMPDFLVAHALSKTPNGQVLSCVVAVFEEFKLAFETVLPDLPTAPSIKPSRYVVKGDDEDAAVLEFYSQDFVTGQFNLGKEVKLSPSAKGLRSGRSKKIKKNRP